MRSIALIIAGLLAILVLAACGHPRRGAPYSRPIPLDDPQVAQGQRAFMIHCHQCHPGGAAGLGPGINDKPLPALLIRTQIRRGMGAMPAFDERHISNDEVEAIATYLQRLRSAPVRAAAR